MLESKVNELAIVDYALSQSTLEQVFLKKIRAADGSSQEDEDHNDMNNNIPTTADICYYYFFWFFSLIIPGTFKRS